MFDQMTGEDRWPDGREDAAAAWIKKELELRDVIVEYPLSNTLQHYKQ